MTTRIALVLAGLALAPGPADAEGAWTTYIKTYSFNDLLAGRDTVWCATGEAGLLRYHRRDSSFVAFHREPSGLASNRLSTLLRDRSGRLWVGTLGAGASRLSADGASWSLVNRFDGLPSDSVTAMAARRDTILIGTTRGLALWNGNEVTGALPDGFNPSPFTSDWMTGIVIEGDSVWIATRTSVYRSQFSGGLRTWIHESTVANNLPPFGYVGLASDGVTIFALTGGALPYRHRLGVSGPWAVDTSKVGGGVFGRGVRLSGENGRIVVATTTGIFQWNGTAWRQVSSSLASDPSTPRGNFAVGVDSAGRLFAANANGLYEKVGDPDTWRLREVAGPPGNNILNLNLHGGRVYVATLTEGIGRFDGRTWRHWPFGANCTVGCDTTFFTANFPFALLVDRQGKKWFGCWGAAIEVYDDTVFPPQGVHHFYPSPPTNNDLHTRAWASAADSSGGRWFGMDTDDFGNPQREPLGLDYYDATGALAANFRPDSSQVRGGKIHGLTVDRTGRIWVGYTGQGIDFFDWPPAGGGLTPTFVMVPGTDRYDVQGLAAHGDTIWALTTSEIVAYRRFNATRILSYPVPAAPGQLAVNPLAVARDGTVWAGTVNGIRVIPPGGATQDFNTRNSPLANDEVRAIRVDPRTGVVWIGTAGGINRYDPGYRPPSPPPVPRLEVTIYPNPVSLTALGVSLKLTGSATSYEGEVYDLQGRRLARFSSVGNQRLVWDGRTEQGDLVRPGVYFLRIESGGKSAFSRVVLLR